MSADAKQAKRKGIGMTDRTRTLAIPMMHGRELLLQAPEMPIKSDMAYIELLESYIGLMKKQSAEAIEFAPAQDKEEGE